MFISNPAAWPGTRPLCGLTIIALALLMSVAARAREQKGGKKDVDTVSTPRRATGALKVITGRAGSVVFINNVRHGVTADNGELDLPRVISGSYTLRVRTVGFTDWSGPVVITAGGNRT